MRRFVSLAALASVAATVALLGAADIQAQPRDTLMHEGLCATAEVPGILVLPDGTSHDAAFIRICFERWLSPVAGIHVLYVGRTPWGMLLSRVGRDADTRSAEPLVVFARNSAGQVRLTGYAWPDRHSMLTMVFGRPGVKADAMRLLKDCERTDEFILIAARRD